MEDINYYYPLLIQATARYCCYKDSFLASSRPAAGELAAERGEAGVSGAVCGRPSLAAPVTAAAGSGAGGDPDRTWAGSGDCAGWERWPETANRQSGETAQGQPQLPRGRHEYTGILVVIVTVAVALHVLVAAIVLVVLVLVVVVPVTVVVVVPWVAYLVVVPVAAETAVVIMLIVVHGSTVLVEVVIPVVVIVVSVVSVTVGLLINYKFASCWMLHWWKIRRPPPPA